MLYNLSWLATGKNFPPTSESERITLYNENLKYFESGHWGTNISEMYTSYNQRISRVVDTFRNFISFPVLLNYQRLIALKTADLVCGEYPIITGTTKAQNKILDKIRYDTDLDAKLYATVIDLCRYADVPWRLFKQASGKYNFTIWDVRDWFPIVSQDGTYTIDEHVIAWISEPVENKFILNVQIHDDTGYEYRKYNVSKNILLNSYTIGNQIGVSTRVNNGLGTNAIIHVRNMPTSGTVYGHDDFTPVDSIIAEIMTRITQINIILDKHANPSISGPASLLKRHPETGESYFQTGDFYAYNSGEKPAEYMVWDGQLEAAFKQIELLLNQLYILSEMGSTLLGTTVSSGGQAISGTALRLKMANPLAKSRRIANMLTLQTKQLLSLISTSGYDEFIPVEDISIVWRDGLPNDPREIMETVKIATGETRLMPLDTAIVEMLERTQDEADAWIKKIKEREEEVANFNEVEPDGEYKEKGSSQAKGSEQGLNDPSTN